MSSDALSPLCCKAARGNIGLNRVSIYSGFFSEADISSQNGIDFFMQSEMVVINRGSIVSVAEIVVTYMYL